MSKCQCLNIAESSSLLCSPSHHGPAASLAETLESLVIVNVPFAVENGSQHFTPGRYAIEVENPHVVMIKGESTSAYAAVRLEQGRSPRKRRNLCSIRYGDQYFLEQIWVAGETSYISCGPSKAEKKILIAMNNAALGIALP